MVQGFVTVVEVDPFPAAAGRLGLTEDERHDITVFLANNPQAGSVIRGTGGLRKLRWAGKSKGKRGGYRVIYYFFNDDVPIYLLTIYAKNEQIDLAPKQKKQLSDLAEQLKAQARLSQTGRPRRAGR